MEPFTWIWSFTANLTEEEASRFQIDFNDTMIRNVSVTTSEVVHAENATHMAMLASEAAAKDAEANSTSYSLIPTLPSECILVGEQADDNLRCITVRATVNGWYYGLTYMKMYIRASNGNAPVDRSEFIMSAMINSTDCYGKVDMGFMSVSATTFAGTVISLSVLVQVFLFVAFSGLGDHLHYRNLS